jgi:protein-S-isoprenylcysteine O-methyltransferase Ste14
MYVGIIVLLLGESLLWRSSPLGIYAACVWLAFHARVVLYEEPTLKRNFPGSFEHYFRTVPRWGLRSHKT